METIGQKLKEIRKRKGLTQEELAEEAKVNLRTIQRIENNNSEPRGTTLSLICEVLDVNIEDLLDYGKTEDNSYLIVLHLSVLSFIVIPLGNIIIPLILWLNKKDKIVNVKSVGAQIINFQIFWTILSSVSIIGFAIFKIMHIDTFSALFSIAVVFVIINVILPIVFAIKVRNGNAKANYPQWIKILK
jgi:transcriptional regulator with XRE-family HTH domain